jgi:hypothetical protein
MLRGEAGGFGGGRASQQARVWKCGEQQHWTASDWQKSHLNGSEHCLDRGHDQQLMWIGVVKVRQQ